MRKIVGLAVLAIFLCTVAIASPDVAVLDGTSWKIQVKPDAMAKAAGERQFKETLTFADGNITVKTPKVGFEASPYSVTAVNKKDWTFVAERSSMGEGTSVWTGTVHDKNVKGKMIWTKNDGEVLTYNFHGNRLH